jgi:stage II sporulation protein M
MRRRPSVIIISLLNKNLSILTIIFFSFILGISLGVFTELMLSADAKESMRDFLDLHLLLPELDGEILPDLFFKSLAVNFGLLIVILLSGLTLIGFPAALLALIYKGAALGFTSALLMDTLNAKGVLLVILTLLPPNTVLVPALCGAAAASLRLASDLLAAGPNQIKKSLQIKAGPFMAFQGLMAILILGGCFIESFISPLLQQLSV